MNEQRRQILEMLAEGKITADEAERLLDAVEGDAPLPRSTKPRYLRVLVDQEDDPGSGGPLRVNVRVPLRLLRAGVRLTSLIPPQAIAQANAELGRSGIPIDLAQLKPQHVEELIEGLDEVSIDVDQPDGKVRVFCE